MVAALGLNKARARRIYINYMATTKWVNIFNRNREAMKLFVNRLIKWENNIGFNIRCRVQIVSVWKLCEDGEGRERWNKKNVIMQKNKTKSKTKKECGMRRHQVWSTPAHNISQSQSMSCYAQLIFSSLLLCAYFYFYYSTTCCSH